MKLSELYARRHELLFKKEYVRAPRYAKWVTHRITPAVVYAAGRCGCTPDQVTLASIVLGWAAAFCLGQDSLSAIAGGALLVEAYYVLDSVDGQLARWKRIFSKSGAFLDVMGNYLVHPWIFVALGIGLARMGLGWTPVALGASAAFGYLWLGILWDVRSNILLLSLRKNGAHLKAEPGLFDAAPAKPGVLTRAFAFIHKLCTFPTAMNLLTFTAVAGWATSSTGPLELFIFFYAIVIPAVALAKMLKMTLSREIDREFESLLA